VERVCLDQVKPLSATTLPGVDPADVPPADPLAVRERTSSFAGLLARALQQKTIRSRP
jgi:hypothetical protein